MKGFQVAGAHTDVGKTFVACALLRAARVKGLSVSALKPVVSGFNGRDWADSDPGQLITAMGQPLTPRRLEDVSPLRFPAPLSPPMAARREGRTVRLDDLLAVCRPWLAAGDAAFGILETAGGVMSPIAEDGLCLDLMMQVPLPILLVGGAYLGAISHNLTALSVLNGAGLTVEAMVVSESADPEAPDYDETVEALRQWSRGVRVVEARRNDEAWAAGLV